MNLTCLNAMMFPAIAFALGSRAGRYGGGTDKLVGIIVGLLAAAFSAAGMFLSSRFLFTRRRVDKRPYFGAVAMICDLIWSILCGVMAAWIGQAILRLG